MLSIEGNCRDLSTGVPYTKGVGTVLCLVTHIRYMGKLVPHACPIMVIDLKVVRRIGYFFNESCQQIS